jgi:4-amino-4-deoxy-L-arabinose transferase-like glycosyltransferase
MLKVLEKIFPAWLRGGLLSRAWVFVALAMVFAVAVRVRLADMPLERDEGEYAYAGQLLLQGVPPYQAAFNMKLPGTYLAYAVSMAVFGQTPTGIHLGLALVNAATIWLMFLLGRKLLDPAAGAVAAVTYALMSLSPDVLGLAGHATHFVVLPAVGGILVLLRAVETRAVKFHFAAGILFGVAFVMKQHGVFFGLFGGLYLIWVRYGPRLLGAGNGGLGSRRAPRLRAGEVIPVDWGALFKELLCFSAGCVLPYLGICLWLWAAGVFPQFWFWTVTYGSKYAAGIPLVKADEAISYTLRVVVGPNLVFWLLPWVGALMMWWDKRLDENRRFLLAALFLFSLASITVGFYFRQHYFIQLLPAVALLIAVGVSRSLILLQRDQSVELFLALGVVVVAVVAAGAVLIGNGAVWFTSAPKKAVEDIYLSTVFGDARDAADYIARNTTADARIAVIGSEPEIYFYSRRRSATGHIYTYALMEAHPYAAKLQDEMIQQIEAAKPEYVVYVNNPLSWLPRAESERRILEWWPQYWEQHYTLVRTITTRQGRAEFAAKDPSPVGTSGNFLLILKRKS